MDNILEIFTLLTGNLDYTQIIDIILKVFERIVELISSAE